MKTSSLDLQRWRTALCGALFVLGAAAGFPAAAAPGLIGDNVTIRLVSTGDGVDASDVVLVGGGVELASDTVGSNIAPNLLTNGDPPVRESVDIGAYSIVVRLLTGLTDGADDLTGWSPGARFEFSGLDIAGETIVGVTSTGSLIDNFDPAWASLVAGVVSLAIDEVEFTRPSITNPGPVYGDITITLLTRPDDGDPPDPPGRVPEPGSMALAGLALLSLWWTGRRRVPLRTGRAAR